MSNTEQRGPGRPRNEPGVRFSGDRMRELRRQAGYHSVPALREGLEEVGVFYSTVSLYRWEEGSHLPPEEVVAALAEVCECRVKDFEE